MRSHSSSLIIRALFLLGASLFLADAALHEPNPLPSLAPVNAEQLFAMLQRGADHEKELTIKKNQLFESIKAVHGESSDELYALAGVQLEDYQAFESFVFGILQVYQQTVSQEPFKSSYDFRSPALKLTFGFQRAVKISHQRLKSAAGSFSDKDSHQHQQQQNPGLGVDQERESMRQVLHGMLKEVSDKADQLEEDMHQNNIVFTVDDGRVETVLKFRDENLVNLVDQDSNEYVMMKPSDSTVIIEDVRLIHDFILILVTSFVLGWMFTWIGLPAFFGYILAGIFIGPSGYNLIQELIQIETLAQLGVVLIVLVLGLEFSLEKIKKMWRLALGGAMTILLVTVVFFCLMGLIIGADTKEAVFVGACISLSSTAVVVKCIKLDQLEHLYGLLVMQDVILGFMLAIIPALSKSGIQVVFAVLRISLSFAIFGLVCFSIVRLIPIIPRVVRRAIPIQSISNNHELMLLGTMAVCMTMLIISEHLGLGMELGCFAAGVIIRSRKGMFETSLKVIEPVRDMFACLFFASIGLHIYPSFLASEAMLLLTLAAGVIGFKYVAICVILYLFKFDIHKSSAMAIALAQISEFGFVLASRAKQLSIISREVYYLLLATTAITLIATPLILKLTNTTKRQDTHEILHHQKSHDAVSIELTDAEKLA
ncbi:Sodium/hydrogen exchanger family-domain-containing protein [Parasitella parasitica]|nr:Sodium/hydrogen exchanger family-domain-containing protein [Parasitella parasitica]